MDKIQLDYMHVAKAAQYCEAYFTSILYAELWALQVEASTQYTLVQIKSEMNLQEIMKKVGSMRSNSARFDSQKNVPFQFRRTYRSVTWTRFPRSSIRYRHGKRICS